MKKLILFLFVGVLFFSSCRKESADNLFSIEITNNGVVNSFVTIAPSGLKAASIAAVFASDDNRYAVSVFTPEADSVKNYILEEELNQNTIDKIINNLEPSNASALQQLINNIKKLNGSIVLLDQGTLTDNSDDIIYISVSGNIEILEFTDNQITGSFNCVAAPIGDAASGNLENSIALSGQFSEVIYTSL